MAPQSNKYPTPVVRLLVADIDGRVLLLRRAPTSHGGGSWCLPGGKIDYGDTIDSAISRELQEETSLHCRSSRFLFLQDGLPLESGGMHCVNLYFECHARGEVAINEESTEFAWASQEQLSRYNVVFGGAAAIRRYWAERKPADAAHQAGLLSAPVLRDLLDLGHYRRFECGEVLLSEGSVSGNAYVLLSGACSVGIHGEIVARIDPVETLGVTATLTGSSRTATVTALQPSDTIEIPQAALTRMLRTRPEMMAAVFRRLLTRNRDASHWEASARADLHGLRNAQQHLLKPVALLRDLAPYVVAVSYQPCAYASGDYYDVIRISPTRTLFVIGDAIGHGSKAAVIMAIARSQVHELAKRHDHPDEIIGALDVHFREVGTLAESSGYLMTMAAVIIDSTTLTAECCVAGHPAPLLRRGAEVLDLTAQAGPCVGMAGSVATLPRTELSLQANDEVLLYTDGAFEVCDGGDGADELLGREGLRDLFRRVGTDVPTAEIPGAIAATVAALRRHVPATDDVTLLLVKMP